MAYVRFVVVQAECSGPEMASVVDAAMKAIAGGSPGSPAPAASVAQIAAPKEKADKEEYDDEEDPPAPRKRSVVRRAPSPRVTSAAPVIAATPGTLADAVRQVLRKAGPAGLTSSEVRDAVVAVRPDAGPTSIDSTLFNLKKVNWANKSDDNKWRMVVTGVRP